MITAQPAAQPTDSLTIAQVAEHFGLSTDTLRYYEKAGLIQPVGRTAGNQRRYASSDLDWLQFLIRLRATGMSIADMQRFAALRSAGLSSTGERLELLRAHRAELAARIEDLQRNALALDDKIDHYEQLLTEQHSKDGT